MLVHDIIDSLSPAGARRNYLFKQSNESQLPTAPWNLTGQCNCVSPAVFPRTLGFYKDTPGLGVGVKDKRGPCPLPRPRPGRHLFDLFYMLGLNIRYLENHSQSHTKQCLIATHAVYNAPAPSFLLQGGETSAGG